MTKENMLILLDEILELDAGTLKGDELLEGLNAWDSIANISFIAMVDEKYGKIISPAALRNAQTVNDLIAMAC